MKKLFVILFLIQMLWTKAQERNLDKNSIQTIIGIIDKRDVGCLSEIKKAKLDFKSREVLYDIIPEGYLDSDYNRHYPYLINLLKEKGIDYSESLEPEFSTIWGSDDVNKYSLATNCYCKASNELLNAKYGQNFIKNIKKTADSLYVMSRIHIPFEYPYGVDDYCMVYPKAGDFLEQKIQIQKDFFSSFVFPKNFIQSNEKRDFFAKTKFKINKDNSISNIIVKIEFKNQKNEKFYNLIADQITAFIKHADWTAAVSNGIKVNSNFDINFYN
ncbi:hypothetical protein [Flavobacterium sharifuzzamanii]|uniref:hypothetical protein n=1 Tax=Flavobacterium sharifuzzamanii TaxID=2211133 RepID=UPI0013005713|nr:hypothetical protein [Flavobacterium sharifuzzamanii]KAF2081433.1 hypothetical protein DMA14_10600 [Flavobacterium sharifuzzamanii]